MSDPSPLAASDALLARFQRKIAANAAAWLDWVAGGGFGWASRSPGIASMAIHPIFQRCHRLATRVPRCLLRPYRLAPVLGSVRAGVRSLP